VASVDALIRGGSIDTDLLRIHMHTDFRRIGHYAGSEKTVKICCACVQLPTYADNVALPAFSRRCCSNQSTDIYSGGFTAGAMLGQTDGRKHTMRTMPKMGGVWVGGRFDWTPGGQFTRDHRVLL